MSGAFVLFLNTTLVQDFRPFIGFLVKTAP